MARPANRLTTRDYKRASRRSPLDLGRFRDIGIGLLAGVLLTSGLFLYKNDARGAPDPEIPRPEPNQATEPVAEGDAAATAGAETGDRYDFYDMLPNFEVVVPEKDREVKRDQRAVRIDRPGVYVLQAGSYKNVADADRVRAQLNLQGINAKVQRVAVDNDVWHRVRVGPIKDLTELNRVRKQLQAADVDGLVIRVGD
jgi:cell division protein FtsN